jgi:hypothetical protein
MTREEILTLHTLPEAEQVEWLKNRNYLSVRGSTGGENDETIYESLAELAFRLRDEFMENHSVYCWKAQIKKLLDADVYTVGTWTASARPIHWIQAALLAIYDKEGER